MTRRERQTLLMVLALAGLPLAARGAEQPLPGLKLVLKDVAGRQRGVLVARSGAVAIPAPGGPDDPTLVGATLVLRNPDTGETAALALPADGWRASSTGTVYRFTNRLAPAGPSPAKVVVLKQGRLLKVGARATGLTLDEPTQGTIEAVLMAGDTRWCVRFGGTLSRDQPGLFLARNAPAPTACPGPTTTTTTPAPTTTSTTTTSTTTTSTTTTTFAPGCAPPASPLGAIAFTLGAATPSCGGIKLSPGADPPASGHVADAAGNVLADLGVGCLYVGGGQNGSLPGAALPDGSISILDVSGADGLALTLAGSEGTGPYTCTRGAGPLRHCADGAPGTNGLGRCTTDADCGGGNNTCVLDARCHFGPPVPIATPTPALSTCTVNVIATDACGAADLATGASTLDVAILARLYLTGEQASPCPRCVAGSCTAGTRAGLGCTPVGSQGTSLDCPPDDTRYIGELAVRLAPLTTGTTVLHEPTGFLCPGQRNRGAFGRGLARTVMQTGVPLTDLNGGTLFATRLAGSFCIPETASGLVNNVVDLPGPGSVSVAGTIGVCLLNGICGTLCNPCTLGPLCDALCQPCVLCLP